MNAVLIATLGAKPQEVSIATQLLLQSQEPLTDVVILCDKLQSISAIRQTFASQSEWPRITSRSVPLAHGSDPARFGQYVSIFFTEFKQWLGNRYRVHLLLADEFNVMTILGLSAAQVLFGTEDHIWHLHLDETFRQSARMLLTSEDRAHLIEIYSPPHVRLPIYFTRIVEAESYSEACVALAQLQDDRVKHFIEQGLTYKERKVAAMIASGMSNPKIANELKLTEKALKKHISRIYKKLEKEFALLSKPQLKRELIQTSLRKWLVTEER